MVLRCDGLHANSLELITSIESNIVWDIISYSDTNVLCSARLLERQLNDAMGILHKRKNQVVPENQNLFQRDNKIIYRRHVSCHGAMYARVLFSEYRTEAGALKHILKFIQKVIDEHYVTDYENVDGSSSCNSSEY